jgi:hypothetical protein
MLERITAMKTTVLALVVGLIVGWWQEALVGIVVAQGVIILALLVRCIGFFYKNQWQNQEIRTGHGKLEVVAFELKEAKGEKSRLQQELEEVRSTKVPVVSLFLPGNAKLWLESIGAAHGKVLEVTNPH